MKFKLRQMEVFRAVMLTGSINAATKLLFITQPAVSRIISHTETTLGFKLFNRLSGKLVPTQEARALFREVEQFYQQALRINEFADDLALGASGALRLTSSPALSHSLIPAAIAEFTRRYPLIRINYHTILLNSMAQDVLSGKVDMAVSVMPLEHPNLTVTPFTTGKMVCVVPRDHELAALDTVSLQMIARYPPLIMHHSSILFGQMVQSAFRRAGLTPISHVEIYQTETACSLVQAGVGIAIVDQYTVAGMGWHTLKAIALEETITLTPCIVRSTFEQNAYVDQFSEVVRSHAQASQAQAINATL